MVRESFYYDGTEANPPKAWPEMELGLSFDRDTVQANIEIQQYNFVREANNLIRAFRTANGPYEGISFRWETEDPSASNNPVVFEGYIDLAVGFETVSPVECRAFIRPINNVNHIEEKIDGMTFGLLHEKGKITTGDYIDIKIIVRKEFLGPEVVMLSVTILLMTREIRLIIKRLTDYAKQAAALIAGGFPGTGAIAAGILLGLEIFAEGLYDAFIIKQYAALLQVGFDYFLPPVITQKSLTFKTALEKIFDEAGYDFRSPLPLHRVPLIPSKPKNSTPLAGTEGIPNQNDFAYRCVELVGYIKRKFNAKLRVTNTTPRPLVELLSLNDPTWQTGNTYDGVDLLHESVVDNATELQTTALVSYTTDLSNFHSSDKWIGNTYEVTVEPITVKDRKLVSMKGYNGVDFPVQLGKRNDEDHDLNFLENLLIEAGKLLDSFAGAFGSAKLSLAQKVRNRAGYVLVSNNYWSVPIVTVWDQGANQIPADYLDIISARALYENYISYNSFVSNNWGGQRMIVTNQRIPFTMKDWLAVAQNKWFKTYDGVDAEFTEVKWRPGEDTATVSYRRRERFTTNLKETKREQT